MLPALGAKSSSFSPCSLNPFSAMVFLSGASQLTAAMATDHLVNTMWKETEMVKPHGARRIASDSNWQSLTVAGQVVGEVYDAVRAT
jgi:hypothetical protein